MKIRKGRPTVAVIDRAALRSNFAEVRKRVVGDAVLMAVVKADAYGHGAPEVARILEREGARAFGVATVEEGVEIRDAGVVHPEVLVLGGFVADQVEAIFHHRMTPVVCDIDMGRMLAERLRGSMRSVPVHVKVDTGLGRLGVPMMYLTAFLTEMKKLKGLEIVGLCSHLGSAVKVTGETIDRQVATFHRAWELLAIHGTPARVRHLANSAALLSRPDLHYEMVRPGLVLYGVHPDGAPETGHPLRPAMSLRTAILQLRRLPAGHGIGYDQTFVTQRESLIASLPIGYADGYPRRLSNRGQVLVRGRRVPIVGRVSMDTTMVDVTDVTGVQRGDEVVLCGRQGQAEILVDEVAQWAETIAYEILTRIGPRVGRAYVN
ncbi:MAG: alanine racemase [Candidatus Binatia bacterium]